MPPTHLTRVDLPAPLSPTSAITSPRKTLKSTLCRTWIAPKLLLILRRARMGESATMYPSCIGRTAGRRQDRPRPSLTRGPAPEVVSVGGVGRDLVTVTARKQGTGGVAGLTGHATGRAPGKGLGSRDPSLGAECDERAGADRCVRNRAGLDRVTDVVDGDQFGLEQDRRNAALARRVVRRRQTSGRRALDQSNRQCRRGIGLGRGVLVDGAGLGTREDRLQARRSGVLTGHRDAGEAGGLKDGLNRT